MVIPQRHLQGSWSYINLFGLLLGLIIGHCIILFGTLFTGAPIELRASAIVILFSVSISLSIVNSVAFFGRYLNKHYNQYPLFLIIAFYAICLIGMVVGTELSFLILYLFFDVRYNGYNQLEMMVLNAFISFVVCSCMLLYEWQKNRFQLTSFKQELEFIKLKKLKKRAQLETIHAKVDPHFLYNSLNAIAGLIPDDVEKAEAMTLKLAQLYRYSTSHANENFSTISEELNIIRNYLEIEQVRFGDRFTFELICNPALYELTIPRFLLQPLVENAVKHGLENTFGQAYVKLKLSRKKAHIEIDVYDNGESFPKNISCGYGFKSIYDKLKLLYSDNYQIKLINVPDKHVSILLPVLSLTETVEM